MCAWIGIDLGTTGARSTVYNSGFKPLGAAYQEYPLAHGPGGRVEQDAALWWRLTAEATRSAMAQAGVGPCTVEGVAVSAQGIALVPVDSAFYPLCPAISWLDTRAEQELSELCAAVPPAQLYRRTGKRASAKYTLPKLMWLKRHEPALYRRAAWFLLPQDFLVARMTGRPVTDHSLASGTMAYSLARQGWDEELCAAAGVDTARLPDIEWAGTAAGTLQAAAARAMGLQAGTPVAVGGQDQKCAALAAGLASGVATVSLGTAAAVEALGPPDGQGLIPCFSFLLPGTQVLEGVVNTAGLNLRWLRDKVLPGTGYTALDALAQKAVGKSRALFLPFLNGEGSPGWGENQTGLFSGLTLETGREEIACAVLEGVAFELRRNLAAMQVPPGQPLRIFGGGAKSAVWCAIIAHATGRPVQAMQSPEMASLGAALLAAAGTGARKAADPTPAGVARVFGPEHELCAHYEALYGDYMETYARHAR